MLFLATALFALVLPIVGPLDDHHFAERVHNHDHIYLNGAPVAHDHAFGASAHHFHPGPHSPSDQPGDNGWNGDVLNLSPATSGLTLASLNAPCHPAPDSLRPPPPSNQANPLERFAPVSDRPGSADLSPPLPPPVA